MTREGRRSLAGTHVPAGWFVLRTAMLPVSAWWQWQEGLQAPHASEEAELAAALDRDYAVLQERLSAVLERREFRRALELASSSLEAGLGEWAGLSERRRARLEHTLVAYLSRACARPAPFALFGAVGVGTLGESTRLRLPEESRHRIVHRLDGAFASELADALSSDPGLRNLIRYAPAPTLASAPNRRLRLVRQKAGAVDGALEAATFRLTPPLERMLLRAADGATIPELVDAVAAGDQERRDRAAGFVTSAIERGLLASRLEPPVTGPEPLAHLIAELERIDPDGPRVAQLHALSRALASLDASDQAVSPARAAAVRAAAGALPLSVPPDAELLHVVRTLPGEELVIGPALSAVIAQAADLLLRVGSTGWPDVLGALRERFVERYGMREVALLELFDPEHGPGVNLFEELGELPPSLEKTRREHLLGLLVDAAARGRAEVRLSDADIERLACARTLSADTAGALVSLSARSPDSDDVEVLVHAVGPEAGRLCARFGDALPELESRLRELTAREQAFAGEALVADVVIRDARQLGNVVQRPRLYDWEIELMGRSGAAPDRRIDVDDLLVSVSDGRFLLRSLSRDAYVEPRQCSALMMDRRRPAMARFLWMVGQGESGPAWTWSWGELGDSVWLPRVRRGRVVLALERWVLAAAEASTLTAPASRAGRLRALRSWRERWGVPREVDLVELDRWVRLDLENVLCVELLLARLHNRGHAVLREAWPRAGHEHALSGPAGGMANELLVPFVRARPLVRSRPGARPAVALTERRRAPGSDWLYLKLYGGSSVLERALSDRLAPVCRELVGERIASLWFALVHVEADPADMHLRLWLQGSPARLLSDGVGRLMHAIDGELADGRIFRVALDTHERDFERYGGAAGLSCAELVFQASTELLTALVECPADRRYWLALAGAWAILETLVGEEQEDWSNRLRARRDELLRALEPPSDARAAFAGHPRSDPSVGEQWLGGELVSDAEAAALERWRTATERPLERLRSLHRDGALTLPLWPVALSVAHRHAARLLAPADRPRAEAQLLDAMSRIAERRRARDRSRQARG